MTQSSKQFVGLIVFALLMLVHTSCQAARIATKVVATKPDDWFLTDEAKSQVDFIISRQLPSGGWWKGYESASTEPAKAEVPKEDVNSWEQEGTIDNGITYTELRILARAYSLTRRENVLASFNKGFDYLLSMQYENGGWPQRFPLQKNYGRHITFNDNAMTAVLFLVKDVVDQKEPFSFVDDARREKAKVALEKGIDCVVKCQVVSGGKLTVWAQQYDEVTLKPTTARKYELEGLTAGESTAILKFLMSLENPSPEVQKAVHAGVAWLEASKITGKRLDKPAGTLLDDPDAPPLWARFYEIDTNRPFFCGRDGVKKYDLTEIEKERRTGYAWYRGFGKVALDLYPQWSQKYPNTAGK